MPIGLESSLQYNTTNIPIFEQNTTEETNLSQITQPPQSDALSLFNERAQVVLDTLSNSLPPEESARFVSAIEIAASSKASSYTLTHGVESLTNRNVVNAYYQNYSGVLSDEAIVSLLNSQLKALEAANAPEESAFVREFRDAIEAPLQRINITA